MRLTLPETKLHGAPIVTPRPAVRMPVVLRDTEHVTTSKKPHHSCEQWGLKVSRILNWLS